MVNVNPKFARRVTENIASYGLASRLVSIDQMAVERAAQFDRAFEDEAARNAVIEQFRAAARQGLEKGAECVIPAGGIVMTILADAGIHEVDNAPVVNGLIALVKIGELAVNMRALTGQFTSKRLTYAPPTGALARRHPSRLRRRHLPRRALNCGKLPTFRAAAGATSAGNGAAIDTLAWQPLPTAQQQNSCQPCVRFEGENRRCRRSWKSATCAPSFAPAPGSCARSTAFPIRVDPGETVAVVGESGSGKSVGALSILRLIPSPPGRIVSRRGDVQRPRPDEAFRRRDARGARRRDRHGVPGADDLAEPGAVDRPADHRDAGATSRQRPRRSRKARSGVDGTGRHRRPAAPVEAVSAPTLGRDATADHDRDRAGLRAEADHRRRADDRARRDDPGADPRTDAEPDAPARRRADRHHA